MKIDVSKILTHEFDINIAHASFQGKLRINIGVYYFLLRKNVVNSKEFMKLICFSSTIFSLPFVQLK